MDNKSQIGLVIAVAVTILAAAFVSFGLPSLLGSPEVTLPDLSQEETAELQTVSVTPDTVQSVIATLARPESYYRELTITLSWTGGSASNQVQIWADGGYVKTSVSGAGAVQNRLAGDGTLYLWYTGDRTWEETRLGDGAGDLAQRIPTYEDVLEADPDRINDARYETKDGRDCIYVEVSDPELDSLDCYWVETATGLLRAAETREDGQTVYRMAENDLEIPLEAGVRFELPDGTLLHESSGL